jgi:hypothetical protein
LVKVSEGLTLSLAAAVAEIKTMETLEVLAAQAAAEQAVMVRLEFREW